MSYRPLLESDMLLDPLGDYSLVGRKIYNSYYNYELISVTPEDYFQSSIGLVMTTEVNFILGNRKYLRRNFSPADYHIPNDFTNHQN